MNYLSIYKNLIRSRKKLQAKRKQDKKNGIYFEEHHIILRSELKRRKKPKSVWNGSWNRILLTAREHFITHMLLWKACKQIYGDNHMYTVKCILSLNLMCKRIENKSSRSYNFLRAKVSQELSKNRIGKNNPAYGSTKNRGSNNGMYGKTPWNKGIDMPLHLKKYYSKLYERRFEITFLDDSTILITNLKKWCIDNGYNMGALYNVKNGKKKKHRDIKMIRKLN